MFGYISQKTRKRIIEIAIIIAVVVVIIIYNIPFGFSSVLSRHNQLYIGDIVVIEEYHHVGNELVIHTITDKYGIELLLGYLSNLKVCRWFHIPTHFNLAPQRLYSISLRSATQSPLHIAIRPHNGIFSSMLIIVNSEDVYRVWGLRDFKDFEEIARTFRD